MQAQERVLRRVRWVVLILLVLTLLNGCVSRKPPAPGTPQSQRMTAWVGAGVGYCDYDPKDRSLFDGIVDAGDTCARVVGRVQMTFPPPRRLIPEKGDPVPTPPSGPFLEAGFTNLGETGFDGMWSGTGTPTTDVGTLDAEAWHAAIGYSYPVSSRVGVFGKVGYSFWDVEENELFGGVPEFHSASGEDLLLGAGVDIGLTPKWVLEVELGKYFDVGEVGETGKADADTVSVTFLYRF